MFGRLLVEERPSLGSKPVSVPKVATRRPTAVHTSPASCKLRSRAWGLGLAVGQGPPLGNGHLQLPFWGQANGPSSGDVHGPAARIQARLDEVRCTYGRGKPPLRSGHPTTPSSPAPLLPRPAQGLHSRHFPYFQMPPLGRPGESTGKFCFFFSGTCTREAQAGCSPQHETRTRELPSQCLVDPDKRVLGFRG